MEATGTATTAARPLGSIARRRLSPGRLARIAKLGVRSLALHPLRSFLTTLGIIIGVGAVIFMLAVVEGKAEDTQAKIRARGATNIILRAKKPAEQQNASATVNRMVIYGLTYTDARAIRETLPGVEVIVPVREVDAAIYRADQKTDTVTFGTVPWYPEVARAALAAGRWFSDVDVREARPVTVLGAWLAERLFRYHDPLGETIRIGSKPFTVVGILAPTVTSVRDEGVKRDRAAYIPLTTVRERYGERNVKRTSGSLEMEQVELHQVLVKVRDIDQVLPTKEALVDLLSRLHKNEDYVIDAPLDLLNEARREADASRQQFGTIAGISLLVGGIGIMNIMLASVTERTREIGVRRALGAFRRDITAQFLVETLFLSLIGGLVGACGGVGAAAWYAWKGYGPTIVTPVSIMLAFGISAAVGILAGLYPAVRAARMDPITALRHE